MATNSSSLAQRIHMNRGAWQATVQGITRRQTGLKQLSMRVLKIKTIKKKEKEHLKLINSKLYG